MIATIKHGINLARHYFRDINTNTKRSGKWQTLEKHFLEANPSCAACGSKDRLNAHHIMPFHLYPELELELSNLITLCMSKKECHLQLGHIGNFRLWNPNVREEAKIALAYPEKLEEIIKNAKLQTLEN